jgi:3-oxoacyl-[acyl-carrier-protein] synthase II
MSAPEPSGDGARRAMQSALKHAKLDVKEVGYLNAHATSTPVGDPVELTAVRKLWNNDLSNLAMSSTKSSTGHLLGAAGAVEAIFTLLALCDQVVPPTLNLHDPCDTGINLVPLESQSRKMRYALSNSFGFGGTNAALVLAKV